MLEFVRKCPDWLRNGLLVVAGGLIGWFANQYMDHRTANKVAIGLNYDQFNVVSSELEKSLKQFADIANGKKSKTDEDVELLQSRLLSALSVVEDLQRRIGVDEGILDNFRSAAVDLKQASNDVTGPLDAKKLVVAVNDYLVAEKKIKNAAVSKHKAFLF